MDPGNDDRRRLSPEEDDARAAALIAQYRNERKAPRSTRSSTASSSLSPSLGLAFVYLCGVVGGVVWHAKPLAAILIGLPLVLIVHAFVRRRRSDAK